MDMDYYLVTQKFNQCKLYIYINQTKQLWQTFQEETSLREEAPHWRE